ncbi:unnamed protein product [marine sediment metagenome]|uniref:AIG1-type G domain-containing protein n=1 Tax=marine sediment metagenome TaxID=412755 RepID=X1C9E9_9ZZZZ
MSYVNKINVICVGHSGHGISALCNFLLKDKRFESSNSASQVTNSIDTELMTYKYNDKEYNLNIVDTPGYGMFRDDEHFESLKKFIEDEEKNILVFVLSSNALIESREKYVNRVRNLVDGSHPIVLSKATLEDENTSVIERCGNQIVDRFNASIIIPMDLIQWVEDPDKRRNEVLFNQSEENRVKLLDYICSQLFHD